MAGVQSSLVNNKSDGTWDLEEMIGKIRVNPDCHEPTTDLIIVENTHNMCGGKVRIILSHSTNEKTFQMHASSLQYF